ncbi:hypothetical protein CRE_26839 [Caenorhabditis remanei]|uniref:Uncharacterized protein n=1 Tax=Caenorhabditis remanei TaxID=31234 RepID=E3NKK4_CAERE|nr:hypothetical protein CRE_26839 [Caenorhabditis remanei]
MKYICFDHLGMR